MAEVKREHRLAAANALSDPGMLQLAEWIERGGTCDAGDLDPLDPNPIAQAIADAEERGRKLVAEGSAWTSEPPSEPGPVWVRYANGWEVLRVIEVGGGDEAGKRFLRAGAYGRMPLEHVPAVAWQRAEPRP